MRTANIPLIKNFGNPLHWNKHQNKTEKLNSFVFVLIPMRTYLKLYCAVLYYLKLRRDANLSLFEPRMKTYWHAACFLDPIQGSSGPSFSFFRSGYLTNAPFVSSQTRREFLSRSLRVLSFCLTKVFGPRNNKRREILNSI